MEVSSPKLNLLATDKGIKLMLALESHNAFPISTSLMSLKVIYFQFIFLIDFFYKKTDLYAGIWNKLHQISVQQGIQKKAEIAVKRSRMWQNSTDIIG